MNLQGIRNIYLVGDLHFGLNNNSIEWSEIQRDFLLNFMLSKIDEDFDEDSDILVFEGDIFHYREAVNVRVQNEALDIFSKLANKFKRGVFGITGNHDVYYKDNNEIHSLRTLSNLASNIHIFESPEVLTINNRHSFLMLPWVENFTKLNAIIKQYQTSCQYMICHLDIKGFKFNKWVTVERGLDLTALSTYERVYSGHIHIRQEKANVLYTGIPYQTDRGDIGNFKGFYKLTIEDYSVSEKFIQNTHSPLFLKFDLFEVLEMSQSSIVKSFKNNFVDIMVNVNFINKVSVPQILEKLSGSGYRKLEFFTYAEKDKLEIAASSDFNSDNSFNITTIFKKYLNEKGYSSDFKKRLANKFVEVHKSVKDEKLYA